MISIEVYHTHIEVYPYRQGDNERIEKLCSLWIDTEFRYDPLCYYIDNDTLYLPRGINIGLLEKEFNAQAKIIREHDKADKFTKAKMTVPPRNDIQKDSIDFLIGEGIFKSTRFYSQQSLNLDTGDGKTYCMINSIIQQKYKAVIITHINKIKEQWISSFENMTNIPKEMLINVRGHKDIDDIISGKINGYIYFINHKTINAYANKYGWNAIRLFFKSLNTGIKVYDEAHLNFRNITRIDMFSNTKKTYYLTANFSRSDPKEKKLYERCFASVYKFGEETKEYEGKRKHIIYVPVLYRSNPPYWAYSKAMNQYGFSVLGFIEYALYQDEEKTMLNVLTKILDISRGMDGKILITSPKIETADMIKQFVMNWLPEKSVGTIHSKNKAADNLNSKNCDIISSTIKSCGTGVDIKGLRIIINLEPFSSNITANQLTGRLREYAPDKDTYIFDLIDIAFPTCQNQYKSKMSYLKKKCKEIKIIKI